MGEYARVPDAGLPGNPEDLPGGLASPVRLQEPTRAG